MDTKSCDVSKETAFPDPHGWYSFYVHRSSVIGNWESVLRRLIVQKRRECLKRLWKADPPSGSDCTTVLLYFLALTWYKSLVAPWNHDLVAFGPVRKAIHRRTARCQSLLRPWCLDHFRCEQICFACCQWRGSWREIWCAPPARAVAVVTYSSMFDP